MCVHAHTYTCIHIHAHVPVLPQDDLTKLSSEIEGPSMAVFCMATYGEGDPTDNAQEFEEWLRSGEPDLSGLKYTVFALGNKTYEHYNAAGKYVDQQLAELGAERLYCRGEGDDDGRYACVCAGV